MDDDCPRRTACSGDNFTVKPDCSSFTMPALSMSCQRNDQPRCKLKSSPLSGDGQRPSDQNSGRYQRTDSKLSSFTSYSSTIHNKYQASVVRNTRAPCSRKSFRVATSRSLSVEPAPGEPDDLGGGHKIKRRESGCFNMLEPTQKEQKANNATRMAAGFVTQITVRARERLT